MAAEQQGKKAGQPMANLNVKGVNIVETFAEAFPMVGTRHHHHRADPRHGR